MQCGIAEEVGRVMTKVVQRCIGLKFHLVTLEVGKREREESTSDDVRGLMAYSSYSSPSRMQVQCALLLLLSAVGTVHCRSTGAPASACANIAPDPVLHAGSSQDLSTNPYQLSLSDFDETNGGEFYYVPGQQYSCE